MVQSKEIYKYACIYMQLPLNFCGMITYSAPKLHLESVIKLT